MKTKLLITGLALIALTALVSAQTSGTGKNQQNSPGKGTAYVDANNNGICDKYETGKSSGRMGKRDGNCTGCGQGQGRKHGQGQGQGRYQGQCSNQQGQGKKNNFVDADKDGICDRKEPVEKK